MLKFIKLFIAAVIFSLPQTALAGNLYDDITKDDLWVLIEARDFAATEAMFAKSHAQSLQNADESNHTRWLYESFGTNNPETGRFVQGWLQNYPDSAYAHTAAAWVHYITGGNIRGEKIARETYPDAMSEFTALHRTAWEHAIRADELAPDLLPASDAIIRLSNSTYNRKAALGVLDRVMTQQPNHGTLSRALDITNPGWGGSWEMAERMCDYYGPILVVTSKSNPVMWCKLKAAGTYHMQNHEEWYRTEAEKREFSSLDDLYASRILCTQCHAQRGGVPA